MAAMRSHWYSKLNTIWFLYDNVCPVLRIDLVTLSEDMAIGWTAYNLRTGKDSMNDTRFASGSLFASYTLITFVLHKAETSASKRCWRIEKFVTSVWQRKVISKAIHVVRSGQKCYNLTYTLQSSSIYNILIISYTSSEANQTWGNYRKRLRKTHVTPSTYWKSQVHTEKICTIIIKLLYV